MKWRWSNNCYQRCFRNWNPSSFWYCRHVYCNRKHLKVIMLKSFKFDLLTRCLITSFPSSLSIDDRVRGDASINTDSLLDDDFCHNCKYVFTFHFLKYGCCCWTNVDKWCVSIKWNTKNWFDWNLFWNLHPITFLFTYDWFWLACLDSIWCLTGLMIRIYNC